MSQLNANWCEKECPFLAIYNQAFLKRKGVGLIHNLKLTGDDETIAMVVEKEKEVLFPYPVIYAERDTDTVELDPSAVYFFKECSIMVCNPVDLSGFRTWLDDLADLISLDGFKEYAKDTLIERDVKQFGIEQFCNNTVLAHFAKYGDDPAFHKDDLNWYGKHNRSNVTDHSSSMAFISVEKEMNKQPEPSESSDHKIPISIVLPKETVSPGSTQESEENVKSESESEKETQTILDSSEETQMNVKSEAEHDKEEAPVLVSEKSETSSVHEEHTDSESETPVIDAIPAEAEEPEVTEKAPTVQIVRGRKLTDEESKRNQELLQTVKQAYKSLKTYITSNSLSGKYTMLLNVINKSISKNQYDKQLSEIYLKMNPNRSSELYSRLLETDQIAQEFNLSYTHRVKTLTCKSCGKSWEEDITFAIPGTNMIPCKVCGVDNFYDLD